MPGSLGPTRSALVRALTARRAFRRRRASTACESCRDPGSRSSSPRLRAAQLFCARVIVQAFPSLWLGAHGAKRGSRTPSVQRNRAATFGPVGGPGGRPQPAPQSKPVTRTSRLVAQDRAVGGIRVQGRESWPQGQPPIDSTPIAGRYVNQTKEFAYRSQRPGDPRLRARGGIKSPGRCIPGTTSCTRGSGTPALSGSQTLTRSSRPRALEDSDMGTSLPALPNPRAGMFP